MEDIFWARDSQELLAQHGSFRNFNDSLFLAAQLAEHLLDTLKKFCSESIEEPLDWKIISFTDNFTGVWVSVSFFTLINDTEVRTLEIDGVEVESWLDSADLSSLLLM